MAKMAKPAQDRYSPQVFNRDKPCRPQTVVLGGGGWKAEAVTATELEGGFDTAFSCKQAKIILCISATRIVF